MAQQTRSLPGRQVMAISAGAIVLIYAVLLVASYLDPGFNGKAVARGTRLDGDKIAGYSKENLQAHLDAKAKQLAETEVRLGSTDDFVSTTSNEVGLSFSREATTNKVQTAQVNLLVRPFAWASSFFTDRNVTSLYSVDESALHTTIEALDIPGSHPAREPNIETTDGDLQLLPGAEGRGVDVLKLASELEALAAASDDSVIMVPPPLVSVPPKITDEAVAAVIAEAEEATKDGLTVVVEVDQQHVAPNILRSWVVLDAGSKADEVSWAFDQDAIQEHVAAAFSEAGTMGTDSKFVVEDQQVKFIPGDGATVCCNLDSAERIDTAIRTNQTSVSLSLREAGEQHGTAWAESLGVIEPVASFTSTHACCQNRVVNIHKIADDTRGVLILPGETFSLNGHVGQRTSEKGYLSAGGITNGVMVSQLGGGISQFTTALFNAAFFAGLDFGEYQSHSIYFSRYPYGREATLSWPHPDLQIKNNSPYGVLIWPTYTDTEITVTLYSTKHVDVEQTGQTKAPQGTCTRVRTERTRSYHDGTVKVDTVTALYRRVEGENCSGESSVPTTAPAPTTPPPTNPTPPPATTPPTEPTPPPSTPTPEPGEGE